MERRNQDAIRKLVSGWSKCSVPPVVFNGNTTWGRTAVVSVLDVSGEPQLTAHRADVVVLEMQLVRCCCSRSAD